MDSKEEGKQKKKGGGNGNPNPSRNDEEAPRDPAKAAPSSVKLEHPLEAQSLETQPGDLINFSEDSTNVAVRDPVEPRLVNPNPSRNDEEAPRDPAKATPLLSVKLEHPLEAHPLETEPEDPINFSEDSTNVAVRDPVEPPLKMDVDDDEHQATDSGSTVTATVFVAAPEAFKHIAISGLDANLGAWKKPMGTFSRFQTLDHGFCIYKGQVPVPSVERSPFKFVSANPDGRRILDYEGKSEVDDRHEELLPESWHFFILKEGDKSFFGKYMEKAADYWTGKNKDKLHQEIVSRFLYTAISEAQTRKGNLEDRLDFLLDCFAKIWKVTGSDKKDCWESVANRFFQHNSNPSMEKLFWLTVAPNQSGTENLPKVVVNFTVQHAHQYSLFLDDLLRKSEFRRIKSKFHGILKRFASQSGPPFWWIVFRLDSIPKAPKQPEEWVSTIVNTMTSYPSVLFDHEKAAAAAVKFLVDHSQDYDTLFDRIAPFLKRNPQYEEFFYHALNRSLLAKRITLDDSRKIIQSKFIAAFYQDLIPKNRELYLSEMKKLVEELFAFRTVSDSLRLLIRTPEFLNQMAETTVLKILEARGKNSYMWNSEFVPLAEFESEEKLRKFPEVRKKLLDLLLGYAQPLVQAGALSKIPSLKVILMAIEKTTAVQFLTKPDFDALQRILDAAPAGFFDGLQKTFANNLSSYQQLRQYRKGDLQDIVDRIEQHLRLVQELVDKIRKREILLRQIRTVFCPKVSAYLLLAGLKDEDLETIISNVAELKNRHRIVSELITNVGRIGDTTLLELKDWEGYLKSTNVDNSEEADEDITLFEAVQLECPVPLRSARWLLEVGNCQLFQDKIWTPLVQSLEDTPLSPRELAKLIDDAAEQWIELAEDVSTGTMAFAEMEKLESLDADKNDLMKCHLKGQVVKGILEVYRDFRSLRDIRHSIAPFVAALRNFRIRDLQPINAMYDFIRNNVLQRWEGTTVQQVRRTSLLEMVHQKLRVDPDRPESKATIEFVSSMVVEQEDGSFASPLLTWLRSKNEKDMQAMGRILQGTLLEAYGMLQTLSTRIAPFLNREFRSYEELLTAITESERRFAEERSHRVRSIDFKFLLDSLQEIDAAVKASVTSPVEDAKEKLTKMTAVAIRIKNDELVLNVLPNNLTLDELKQAYQLLEMAAGDEGSGVQEENIVNARRYVPQILRLFAISQKLFTAGWLQYRLPSFEVTVSNLEEGIKSLELHLTDWLDHWSRIGEMPLLSVFPRDYLLHLADLILHKKVDEVVGVMQIFLPRSVGHLEAFAAEIVRKYANLETEAAKWLTSNQLFEIFEKLHEFIGETAHRDLPEVKLPALLEQFGRILNSYFVDRPVQIFNVSRELVVGSAIAAFLAVTKKSIDPSRILFVTRHTTAEEVSRFMVLWANADPLKDFFVMVHIERLVPESASALRDCVVRILQERRPKLLLLAQHQHQVQVTKSIAARLCLIADRMLEVNFIASQLREAFKQLLPCSSGVRFFVSQLPGCGKTQQVLQVASEKDKRGRQRSYYRVPIRSASVEDLLSSLNRVGKKLNTSTNEPVLLHLDVAQCTSPEFNDIILSLLIHGALFDPKRPRLGFWTLSAQTMLAVELASPLSAAQFPIVDLLGELVTCECKALDFGYQLARIPRSIGGKVCVEAALHLLFAATFLELRSMGPEGIVLWDQTCDQPESFLCEPVGPMRAFDLFLMAFQNEENRAAPTYTSINSLALFLYRHVTAMTESHWFNHNAALLFDGSAQHATLFKTDIFNLLAKVASDTVARSLSMKQAMRDAAETRVEEWPVRQRALLLLGLNEAGQVLGVNVVGRDEGALKKMFHKNLLPILEGQGMRFQQLCGFGNLLSSRDGAEVVVNSMRSLLLLDGTQSSLAKVRLLDGQDRRISAVDRLKVLTGPDLGYVLTGDNLTKMMFALYRIRCGLPVVAFGEAGVGKSALFRFLFHTLLGHQFKVCNVNSGTTTADISRLVEESLNYVGGNPQSEVFLFFDEMNTADVSVIAMLKEMMLDGHYNGEPLPQQVHLLGAANPYRYQNEADKEAAVGLVFQFTKKLNDATEDVNRLVYRVNPLPLAMYDHVYDFGHHCDESEATYIYEICRHHLSGMTHPETIDSFAQTVIKSHRVTRALSSDPPSSVSLRDAARAATLFRWFHETRVGKMLASSDEVAEELTIYLAYAFRFEKRGIFLENVFGNTNAAQSVLDASQKLTKMLYKKAHGASIGAGAIALNTALCENLFALFVCVLNGIFLIIVGRPGTSKSLSVEILKLVLSAGNHTLRQELGGLPALTELYFQCSPLSTSSGFRALFDSAQRLSTDARLMLAMVVLDELGLADQSPEKPIKVLHAELERKAVLTSGETEGASYSVVALSNWVVDAAQVNRGILVRRQQARRKDLLNDLLQTAKELSLSLLKEHAGDRSPQKLLKELERYLYVICSVYTSLDANKDIGGGHFYSMRDFFFCVKNFVCSMLSSANRQSTYALITDKHIIKSVTRNFGGHRKAQKEARFLVAESLELPEAAVSRSSPIDLIIENILDSTKKMSIHIARHLMILNKSLIGLQLLNKHVKGQLNEKLDQGSGSGWHVLFGPCFPEDLQIMSVTRKLRQVEQAIRSGGVLILCHADQLFESLYMVLNQQYWAQGDVTMTQIALGPSIRAIALPNGPFRIIALQDTHRALNREAMSPAILSRFEKHELNARDILNENGQRILNLVNQDPIWMIHADIITRQRLLYGYHEDSFASLAVSLQEEIGTADYATRTWMKALSPMEMVRLEADHGHREEVQEHCRTFRDEHVLDNMLEALDTVESKRLVIMTNTMRHVEVDYSYPCTVIRLFELRSELQLHNKIEEVLECEKRDKLVIVHHDAISGPIEQFQFAKYEMERRFNNSDVRVVFVVHVDPRPANISWVFSFGDGWDYVFVDDIVPVSQTESIRLPLKSLVQTSSDGQNISEFICNISEELFKTLLLELLGPIMQLKLASLGSGLGQFFSGVRSALGLPSNSRMVQTLQKCLVAQLESRKIRWNVVEAVRDEHFDSSSSLSEALWSVFKNKLVLPLAHVLIISDVWRVSDPTRMTLWCDFIEALYPDGSLAVTSDGPVQVPVGFRLSTQPFGRLLSSLEDSLRYQDTPLSWLFRYVREAADSRVLMADYFRDWLLLKTAPHLHTCIQQLPMNSMRDLIQDFFHSTEEFLENWVAEEAAVIAAIELLSIAQFAKGGAFEWGTNGITNWTRFTKTAAQSSLDELGRLINTRREELLQSVTSIEISEPLRGLLDDDDEELSNQWLGLRIAKLVLLFDSSIHIKASDLRRTTGEKLIAYVTNFVVESVIKPRFSATRGTRLSQLELQDLLELTGTCRSTDELAKALKQCPVSKHFLLKHATRGAERCPSCKTLVAQEEQPGSVTVKHLKKPDPSSLQELFQRHQEFLFFFERVAEIFVEHFQQKERQLQSFLQKLVDDSTNLRVSWRFLTVVVRAVLATEHGAKVMNEILATLPCNRPQELNPNGHSLLQALLYCADEDERRRKDRQPLQNDDPLAAAMLQPWTVERIHQVAAIRRHLRNSDGNIAVSVLNHWARWNKNSPNQRVAADCLLFFILRLVSDEGDETKLGQLLRDPRLDGEVTSHRIVGPYLEVLSPISLGFLLLPGGGIVAVLDEQLSSNQPVTLGRFEMLHEVNAERAPYLARLALHVSQIARMRDIGILRALATSARAVTRSYLPGINKHPFLESFEREPNRWYICICGYANVVGNCGELVADSKCTNCNARMGAGSHVAARGVRRAQATDFQPPKGLFTECLPTTTPTYAVRNTTAVVTRLSMLLTSLSIMAGVLEMHIDGEGAVEVLRSLPLVEQKPEHRGPRELLQLLSTHIMIHLKVFFDLLYGMNHGLTVPDQFRIFHLLLHKLIDFENPYLSANAAIYENLPQARENFEAALADVLNRTSRGLLTELQRSKEIASESTKKFQKKMNINDKEFWAYGRHVFSDRQSVQLLFARNPTLAKRYSFVELLLDEEVWARKLAALEHFGDALRFLALVRTTLQRNVTQEEALKLTIAEGFERIVDCVMTKPVILDRGRSISTEDGVLKLFEGIQKLWACFGDLPNGQGKTFLEHFECQPVALHSRPRSTLEKTDALVFVLAGCTIPESVFVVQLLAHAVEAAAAVASNAFIQPYCRKGSGRVKISCASSSALADFDESLYAHVPMEQVDQFLSNHAIDVDSLPLAESFAAAAVIGVAGSTIAEDLVLEQVPEFVFKNSEETENYMLALEREFLAWQPVSITPDLRDLILDDLEKNRSLPEARSLLLSVLQHVLQTTEPLLINKVRVSHVCDVIQDLLKAEIITNRHVSQATMNAFNSHLKLEIRHALGLVKSVNMRMRGYDIFGGRVPEGWKTMLPAHLAEKTRAKLRGLDVVDSLLQLVTQVSNPASLPSGLEPKKSLLNALRLMEGDDFVGIPAELRMEHLGHVLAIAETLAAEK